MTDGQFKPRFQDRLKELINLKNRQTARAHPPEPTPQPQPMVAEPIGDEFFENDPNTNTERQVPIRQPQGDIIDPSLMQQPAYDDGGIQILNDIASDESLPVLGYYIGNLSQLGEKAQGRLIAMASAFQSKNQVFSNIVDTRDYMMAQDDFKYAHLLSKADFTAFDLNTDYFVAQAISEEQFNIRLRRSRRALNLQMINTQRTEMSQGGGHQQEEHQKIWQKIPFLGGGGQR